MIIVEGPDGAGKTTLVRQLQREFNLPLGLRGTEDRKLLYKVTRQDTYTALAMAVGGIRDPRLDALQPGGPGRPRIWDRLFYSELVYADIVGRPVEFTQAEQTYIRRIIEALCCPIIVCMPSLETVTRNVMNAEQMDGVKENVPIIYERYSDLLVNYTFPEHALVYDYEATKENKLEAIKSDIRYYLEERTERTWSV